MDNLKRIESFAKERFSLGPDSYHGLAHWKRVLDNGMYLTSRLNLNTDFIHHFAWLHDCCRENESFDPDHGDRAAVFAKTLYKKEIQLKQELFDKLLFALENHNRGMVSDDLQIGVCWDADRLELGRVGIYPDSKYMSTPLGKKEGLIDLCYERSIGYDRSFEKLDL